MAVAKSYQSLEIIGEPYEVSKRKYVLVRTNDGKEKQVRWYTDAEYAKLYPGEPVIAIKPVIDYKHILGFDKGYITIFKGVDNDWFNRSNARYAIYWGWYVVSTEEIQNDMPPILQPIKLTWEEISKDNKLLPSGEIQAYVNKMIGKIPM